MTAKPAAGWRPRRILLAADHVEGLRDYVAVRRTDLEWRARPMQAMTPADLEWAEVYVGFRRPPLNGWGTVRWIHCIGAGVDAFVFRRPLPDGVLLTKSPEDFGPAIGEWCLARALAVNQHLLDLAEDQRAHRWSRREGPKDPTMLRGQRAVVAGTGAVGRGIARAFRPLGCRVDGLSRSGRAVAEFDRVEPVSAFAGVAPGADWLILALPLTEATWHFLDRARLAQCAGAYLMNVGRGALVDEAALPEALDRGWIRGAALDVFETEPLPPESPLWERPEVILSPHLSGPSTVPATGDGFLECLTSLERGQPCRWAVDPAVGY